MPPVDEETESESSVDTHDESFVSTETETPKSPECVYVFTTGVSHLSGDCVIVRSTFPLKPGEMSPRSSLLCPVPGDILTHIRCTVV